MPINQFSQLGSWWTKAPMMDPTSKPTSSSKYKGVVPQPNGRWGAQIYENHHRVWLGTFDTQEAAALSYDRAATMFRGRDATLNFLPNQYLDQEQTMQDRDINIEEYETDETTVNHNIEDEHMFEKPLTPSDVGKLNRLVIPKQHAEKYFPLVGGDSGEKGLLLSFEDELEKPWRFRYSYWNSSQSYVLTKGWSRFVKEKRLDAGDVVFFERRRLDGGGDLFLIRWRRRVIPVQDSGVVTQVAAAETGGWTRVFYSAHPYPSHPPSTAPVYIHSEEPIVQTQTTPRNSNSKRLRLFGVNLDCQPDESEPATSNGLSFSSQGRDQLFYSQVNDGSNYFSHKDYNFSQDINQTRNSQ